MEYSEVKYWSQESVDEYYSGWPTPNRKRMFSQSEVKSMESLIRSLKQTVSYFYPKVVRGT